MNRLPRIKLAACTADGWANLSGPSIKSAMTKHASDFFKLFCLRHFREADDSEKCVTEIACDLDSFYAVLQGEDWFLRPRALRELQAICDRFAENYMRAREYCRQHTILAWEVTPKVHKLGHVVMYSRLLIPRKLAAYSEESAIGSTCKVWSRCLAGRYTAVVQRNVLAKRLLGAIIRLEDVI